jgi:hypothetical protein
MGDPERPFLAHETSVGVQALPPAIRHISLKKQPCRKAAPKKLH